MTPRIRCHLDAVLARHGKTRTDVFDVTHYSESHLCAIARGYHAPSILTVLRVLDALQAITGERFDVRDLWDSAAIQRPAAAGGVPVSTGACGSPLPMIRERRAA